LNQRLALLLKMVRHYEPATYNGPVLLVRIAPYKDSLYGWQGILSNAKVVQVGGDHKSMFKEPPVSAIASEIRLSLRPIG
jgi:thioesterase domain-containing protein